MKALAAINNILGVVPALVWALALLACAAWGWSWMVVAADKEHERAQAQALYDGLNGAVVQLKATARLRLETLTAERDRLQKNLDERHRAQEIRDANHAQQIGRLERQLRLVSRAGGGPGLRDPNAAPARCGGGGGGAASDAARAPSGGAGDAPEAPGLLSLQLESLLLRLVRDADTINRAYAACRADALIIRGRDPLPAPSEMPAE